MTIGNQRNGIVHIVEPKMEKSEMKFCLEFIKEWGLFLVPFICFGIFWLVITLTNILY
jgi:hypothetical protein